MLNNISIKIYYGPLSWFREQVGGEDHSYLLDVVNEMDEASRQFTHKIAGLKGSEKEEEKQRIRYIIAESMDFASLKEHAIMNFVGLIRSMNPENLILHNPPYHIHTYIEREFSNFKVEKYSYPTIRESTLIDFYKDFSNRIIGQEKSKELLSAALYPLMNRQRVKPAC